MFGWLRSAFAPKKPMRASALQPMNIRVVRARYDAATITDENRRHWAAADGLSARAANGPEVRRKLRNHSRYEVCNNSYAQGIVLTLAGDVIGTGPRLQMLLDEEKAGDVVEQEFMGWAAAVRLPEKLRTMRVSAVVDGEAFAVFSNNPHLASAVKLDLRLLEADQVATPSLMPVIDTERSVDGIDFDEFGNPTVYHVLKYHPGDNFPGLGLETDDIPAEAMVHLFRMDRPGQARGLPQVMPALPLFAQLRRYTLAVLGAAETAADFAGVVYTDAPANGEADEIEAMDTIELESRALLTMPGGWKMAQVKAEQPTTTYGEFKKEILNEIARCVLMPSSIAAGSSAGLNYASGRLDHQTYFRAIHIDQAHMASVILDRIFDAWMNEAVLVEGLLPQSLRLRSSRFPHQWFWDGFEHVDPVKEAKAQEIRLANNLTTLTDEYARKGQDAKVKLRVRKTEKKLEREMASEEGAPAAKPDLAEV